ncbi:MAG: InlB B-repeat-containing protein [Bacteroidaceae bacterium]|nr:InlB B-repeat-containing protein [Bacteroidaceae bacterium]
MYFYKVVSDGWHAGGFEGERYYGHSIRPVYEYPTHKITYLIDGNEYKSFMIKEGETITPEIEPTKEGFTFSGWSEIPETMPSNDVTVTGTFTINSYTLTYMVDGKEYKKASVKYGSSITAEAAPTKEGYTFSGWSGIPKTMPAHDVTVTGTFTINSYTLTYMVDGQVFKTVSVKYGSTITTEAAPTKEGYTFSGWDNIPATMPAHDVTVTGTFTINKYKVTFVVDGQVYGTTEIEYGADVNPIEEPSKEGYTFSGWQNLPEDMPSHDIIVTGTFTINKYIITFVVDGQVYGTTEIEYGADVNPIEEPTKEGYTFSGWQNLPEDMPAHDITITGTFTVNQYKVTFKYGKNVLTTIDVDYGAVIPLPESLNSERYTLIEWLDVPETMPARDIIIYADYVDGIDNITADSKDVQYIQMDGMYTNELKQGLNIIRMKDGTTKKVWVK